MNYVTLGSLDVGAIFTLHVNSTPLRVLLKDEQSKMCHYTFADIGTYSFCDPYDIKVYLLEQTNR